MSMTNKRNQTTFKEGHKRSPESIEKQRQTMRAQIESGARKPPSCKWTKEKIKQRTNAMRKTKLVKYPIGSRRKHRSGKNYYWVVKVSPSGRWPYEHRVVAEELLGRKLREKEHVHHANGNTLDNSPNNLKVVTHSEHATHHGYERTLPDSSLPKGVWSKKFPSCTICGTTSTKHVSKGRCNNCYHKMYRRLHHK